MPAKGVERWLSQRLSHRLGHAEDREDGVCAGVQFRSPASLVAEVDRHAARRPVGAGRAGVAAARGRRRQRGRTVVPRAEPAPRPRPGRRGGRAAARPPLRRGPPAGPAVRVVRRAATRPAARLGGRPRHRRSRRRARPRPRLAARAVATGGGARRRSPRRWSGTPACSPSCPGPPPRSTCPPRLSLFGHTRIPVTEVELLAALGRHREVHLWLPHPSAALWEASLDLTGVVPRADDASHTRVAHPLLASLGRDERELERVLLPVVTADGLVAPTSDGPRRERHPAASAAGRHRRQRRTGAGVRTARPPPATGRCRCTRATGRRARSRCCARWCSACSPTTRRLEPRDILVMCPDIEAYAPLVAAAFGMGEIGGHPGHQLRVRLADRSLTQTNPLLAVVGQLLDLAGGRAEASAVLDLLAADPVRRRFGLTESDLETVTGWVESAGIRWAFDADHREPFGLEGYVQNTWRFGLDRILAGVVGQRRRRPLLRHHAPARRRRQHQHRPRRSARGVPRAAAGGHRPDDREPPRRRLARRHRRRGRPAHRHRAGRRVAGRPGAPRAGRDARRHRRVGPRAAAARRPRADARAGGRPPDPGQLPHRHPHRRDAGADAVGAPPRGVPARSRRRRLPACRGDRRRRRAGPAALHRRARRAQRGPPADARRGDGGHRAPRGHLHRRQRDHRPAASARRTARRAARHARRHRSRAAATTCCAATRSRPSTSATSTRPSRSPSTRRRWPVPAPPRGRGWRRPSVADVRAALRARPTSSSAR